MSAWWCHGDLSRWLHDHDEDCCVALGQSCSDTGALILPGFTSRRRNYGRSMPALIGDGITRGIQRREAVASGLLALHPEETWTTALRSGIVIRQACSWRECENRYASLPLKAECTT